MIGLWSAVALAAPSAEALEASWERWRTAIDAHAVYPFDFDDEMWADVAAGKVARRRERMQGTDRVLGMVWSPVDPVTTWLAIQDPHGEVIDGFVEEELPASTFQHRLVFQSIDLPWPLVSRQWVIGVRNNGALRDATDAKVWERTWALSDERGAKAELDKGVWLPLNEGGWFLVEAGSGTLLGYHVRTVIGGIVPDEAAVRWSFGTLTGMLERCVQRTEWIKTHYVRDHAAVNHPDGTPIPLLTGG